LDKRLYVSPLGDNGGHGVIWHDVCNTTGISPTGQFKFEGEKNEKDTGKKGIEAEHREAIEGQPGQALDHAPEAPGSVVVF
jgi:hypothetical protein